MDPDIEDRAIVASGWHRAYVAEITSADVPIRDQLCYVRGPFAIFRDPSSPSGVSWWNLTHVRTGLQCGPLWSKRAYAQIAASRLAALPIPWGEIEEREQFAPHFLIADATVRLMRVQVEAGTL